MECGLNYYGSLENHQFRFHGDITDRDRVKISETVSDLVIPDISTTQEYRAYLSRMVTHFYRYLQSRLVSEGNDLTLIPRNNALSNLPMVLHLNSKSI